MSDIDEYRDTLHNDTVTDAAVRDAAVRNVATRYDRYGGDTSKINAIGYNPYSPHSNRSWPSSGERPKRIGPIGGGIESPDRHGSLEITVKMRTKVHRGNYPSRRPRGFSHLVFVPLATIVCLAATLISVESHGDTITNQNGTQYQGDLGAIRAIGESPFDSPSGGSGVESVVFVDDGLRRTYIPRSRLALNPTPSNRIYERIKVEQTPFNGTRGVGEIGQMSYVSPFDEYGRRFVVINSERGPVEIHQGITEITPHYCVVEGLAAGQTKVRWRLRVATSSIPRDTLSKIIYRQIDATNPNERLKVVTLYQQAERHKDAVEELEAIIADFPELTEMADLIDSLRSAYARRIIREVRRRFDSGQYGLAYGMIEQFPTDNIASEVLGEVGVLGQDHLAQMELVAVQIDLMQEQIETTMTSIELDEEQRELLTKISEEISTDLNLNNLSRLADFRRLYDDSSHTPDQIVSLAITGWLLGSGEGDTNLAVALSQVKVRDLVVEYLSTANSARREAILAELEQLEGSFPDSLAKIIAHLLPVKQPPQLGEDDIPGFYHMEIDGVDDEHVIEYVVQLPPEYDPYRRYPCIVTLGDGQSPEQQVEWWSGPYDPNNGMRMGQASRHGYIVISPNWRHPDEVVYRYTAREHASVLFSLQDAMRHFSIDTDRVFLSGHSQGGTAAWDIGLAHPDLWAGVIPIVASAGKYIDRYWENGRENLPFYFVHGEYDHRRMLANNTFWNRYFRFGGFDITVSEYLGRGHEHFYEDIHRIFEWTDLHSRNFDVDEFEIKTLRPTDNFFWWVESSAFHEQTVILPAEWPKRGAKEGVFETTVPRPNRLIVKTPGDRVTLWLTPDLVDFSQPIDISINRADLRNNDIRPDRKVLLEDVRTRADRQHPFWARVDWVYGQR